MLSKRVGRVLGVDIDWYLSLDEHFANIRRELRLGRDFCPERPDVHGARSGAFKK